MSTISSSMHGLQLALTLDRNQSVFNGSLTSLSSGSKNSSVAADPVSAGLSAELTSQQQRLSAASTNIQNAVSFAQTGDSILSSVGNVLNRMSELVSLAQDPTQNSDGIANYQTEFQALQNELRKTIGGTTAEIGGTSDVASPLGSFDGIPLFGANPSGYQVVIGASASESMTIPATNLQTGAMLNLIQQDSAGNFTLNVSSASPADLTGAIQQVAIGRATLGGAQARLDLASSANQTQALNMGSALSLINDVDVAAASTQLATANVLVQADAAIAAQANTNAAAVLKLLKQ
jgi:flagellin